MPKIKIWNVVFYLSLFLLVSFGSKFVHFLTDYFWFQEIGFTGIFLKIFYTELGLGLAAGFLMAAILFASWSAAKKISRKAFVIIEPDARVSAPSQSLNELRSLVHVLVILTGIGVTFITANWASGRWELLLSFLNGVPFGAQDPLYNLDIGFYVFTLPFYRFVYHFLLTGVIFSLIIAAAIYFVESRIYLTPRGLYMADKAKIHLAVLGGFVCLLFAYHFELKMYDLLYAQRTLSPGAGYADVNAFLPGLKALRFVALISAALLWITPWYSNTKVMGTAVLLLLGGVLAARLYSEIVQKFQVAPNEIVKETPYINLAIENTRKAYGLTDIQELEFDPQDNLTSTLLRKNSATLNNIRLWEHRPLLTTYAQLQEIRTYYDFLDADNDRYMIDGEYRQVMLSARELVPESLPSRIWINEHLTYTHGYGLCMGPVNRISPEGLPEFFIKDIPPASSASISVTRPEIYFGESRANYAIVNSGAKEFSYPSGDENVYTEYAGTGGVPVKNLFRRLLFAIRFGELKILFSGDIKPESRFIFHRSIRERLVKCAPFLRYDTDPYMVIADDGKLYWMVDGYSVTDRYPYSESIRDINYIRNSVKATVDAYNGTVRLYISEPEDPIIQTYAKIFPGVFRPMDEMPADLKSHVRYPQNLMNIQARIYSTYHMTDPQVFYNKEDLWKIPSRTQGGRLEQMEPYYTIMKLAQVGEKEEFILMIPFTPSKKENMIAWLAARCDPPNYGKLLVYNFPKQKLVYGPQQIESRIDQDPRISQQLTLWNQGGSRVLRGSLLVIPVEQSLLYVQPLYLEASGGGLPELKRIIAAYGNNIAMEDNLESCLSQIFGGKMDAGAKETAATPASSQKDADVRSLARKAREYFERAQRASREGNWAAYGEEIKNLEKVIRSLGDLK